MNSYRYPPPLIPVPGRKAPLVYLGGPMTGYEDYNFPAFRDAAEGLRADGLEVINPAETAGGCQSLSREKYMEIDLAYIHAVDAVVFLPGWRQSVGAKTEAVVATAYGKEIYEVEPLRPVTPGVRQAIWPVKLDMRSTILEEE